ncbi:unnamed protein product [Adineta ricciae]|uniref:Uncharacterized protein n=1 Tax=Adineta ricciae TaxID=249248 RepID=A0A815KU34_ADIRI|nr:unnamed protein product [Adineta ricciae]
MSTTPAAASKTLKNSRVLVFDDNSDTINECLRRHLHKFEKTNRRNKKNARKVASHPTKLAFLIYFDDGGIPGRSFRRLDPLKSESILAGMTREISDQIVIVSDSKFAGNG